MEWQSEEYPPDGTWCWVTDGVDIWPAERRHSCAGGWGNQDTWEDWGGDVTHWIPLEKPAYDADAWRLQHALNRNQDSEFVWRVLSHEEATGIADVSLLVVKSTTKRFYDNRHAVADNYLARELTGADALPLVCEMLEKHARVAVEELLYLSDAVHSAILETAETFFDRDMRGDGGEKPTGIL